MTAQPLWTYCPYELCPLSALKDTNPDHVIPHALGGPLDYAITVSTRRNSELGSRVDAPLIDDFLLTALRSQNGVKSRSGVAEWTMAGESDDGTPVRAKLSPEFELVLSRPERPGVNPGELIITALSAADRDRAIVTIAKGLHGKYRSLSVMGESVERIEALKLRARIRLPSIALGMLKIAYAGAYEALGDALLSDPVALAWRDCILGASLDQLTSLRGTAFDETVTEMLFRKLKPHEHAVAVFVLADEPYTTVLVALFGGKVLSLIVPLAGRFGLETNGGQVVICDARTRQVRRTSFLKHLESLASDANLMGG